MYLPYMNFSVSGPVHHNLLIGSTFSYQMSPQPQDFLSGTFTRDPHIWELLRDPWPLRKMETEVHAL
jgi:hypothetical protein